jgi:hypothetical protein
MIKNYLKEIKFSFMIRKSGLTKKGNLPTFTRARIKRVPFGIITETKHDY